MTRWVIFENCGVYSVTTTDGKQKFFLVENEYNFGVRRMKRMLEVKLTSNGMTEMAKASIRNIMK